MPEESLIAIVENMRFRPRVFCVSGHAIVARYGPGIGFRVYIETYVECLILKYHICIYTCIHIQYRSEKMHILKQV